MGPIFIVLISVAVFVGIFIFLYFIPLGLWFTAWASGVRVSLIQLIVMRIRKVPPSLIVQQLITATKAGLTITANDLETHFLAGGNVTAVVNAIISADKANLPLNFKLATAINLAGREVLEAVQ